MCSGKCVSTKSFWFWVFVRWKNAYSIFSQWRHVSDVIGHCQSLKSTIYVCLWCLSYALSSWGDILWDSGWGCAPGHWISYLISDTYPYSLYYGSTSPGLWSVLHWRVLDQQELFNFPSNALFCILEVWQGFICTVVLRLLSRGTNCYSNKHIRNYIQDGLQSKIGNCAACW